MGTRHIQAVLEGAAEHPNAGREVRMALAELDAIRKAAKAIDGCFFIGEPYRHSETCRDAATLMRSIASEATALKSGGTT